MPPFLPRKRSTPPASPRPVPAKRARLADALDAEGSNKVPSLAKTKTFSLGSDDSSSDSSLSDIDSDQFEDVNVQPMRNAKAQRDAHHGEDAEEEDEDEDIEWEDAGGSIDVDPSSSHIPMANGPLQIMLRGDDDDVIDYGTAAKAGSGKKGPSKREKQVRILTHQLHVQYLLWHNAIRNSWIGDAKVQDILVKQLPSQILREIEKWKRSSGLVGSEASKTAKGKKRRGKVADDERGQRDWGQPSLRLEAGNPDMSHGDPLIMLMKILSAYWKKRFAITAPGLRKRGYGTKHSLKQDVGSLRLDEHDPEKHGERIRNLADFRKIAQNGQGSRDVGAQLFTALLRGLGIEARLVASLQPSGYGWTKAEQMLPRKPTTASQVGDSSSDENDIKAPAKDPSQKKNRHDRRSRQKSRKSEVISLDTDEEGENEEGQDDFDTKDDDSVVDITPSMPKARKPRYDRDLVFPIYWTEAVSPITNKVLAVSPLVLETPVATSDEILSLFEPRGAKAEKGRQVMAYVVAYSSDGTAKDVTVRYLKKHCWPGKTKGVRLPIEKMAIYDKHGRIKRYEDYDWFKDVLSLYTRSNAKRTAVDELEDSTDLVPQQPEKKNDEQAIDTLQSLKTSAEYVLERFLRREEALKPDAEPVRTFISGKGDKYREEPVYLRADVLRCLTAESWHKEGRQPKLGETPMKMVPVRAVTLTRKREAEEHERQYGEKQMQGLYSWDQTEYIIPPPIKDGVIPKNAYGNMDCFVPSMVPKGAVHIPLKGTLRICKKLEIDFAEAVTGFEFGNKRAVPVCTGVVVAKENERIVKDAWREWNEEQRRKQETKMEKLVLDLWRKFVLGLRIRERVQDMYGDEIGMIDEIPTGTSKEDAIAIEDDDDQLGGGFVDDEETGEEIGGGFLLPHEEQAIPMEDLVMDDPLQSSQQRPQPQPNAEYPTPSSSPEEEFVSSSSRSKPGRSSSDSSNVPEDHLSHSEASSGTDDHQIKATSQPPPAKSSKFPRRARPLKKLRNGDHRTDSMSEYEAIVDTTPSTTPKNNPTNDADVDVPSHLSDTSDDNASETEEEEEEQYTPRPTRTRAAKAQTNTSVKAIARRKNKSDTQTGSKSKQTSILSKRTSRSTKAGQASNDAEKEHTAGEVLTTPARRVRGRPRKSTATSSRKSTPKRSSKLLRKESTIVTSPYFGS